MPTMTRLIASTPILAALLFSGAAVTQHEGHKGHGKAQDTAKAAARSGDAYPFDTCPISGKKLGAMGQPMIKIYDGREVRYCCGGCTRKFEKDLATSFAKIDDKIIKDQMALYPITTSVVSGKKLPKRPVDFVHGNRLIRVGTEVEMIAFHKTPAKFFAALDKAVVAAQGKDYVLSECPVSGEEFGSTVRPVDVVVAGRLVRVGCADCIEDVEETPAKFIAMVDAARKAKKGREHKQEQVHKKGHDHKGTTRGPQGGGREVRIRSGVESRSAPAPR